MSKVRCARCGREILPEFGYTCPACTPWQPQSSSSSHGGGGTRSGGGGCGGTSRGCGCLVLLIIGAFFMYKGCKGPSTDGIKPAGVSEEQFRQSPTLGKLKIAMVGPYFKYYDGEFLDEQAGHSRARGYTLSKTNPSDPVTHIEEDETVLESIASFNSKTVSRGRKIPRNKVRPVQVTFGNYMVLYGEKVFEKTHYYSPPETASPEELREVNRLLRNQ